MYVDLFQEKLITYKEVCDFKTILPQFYQVDNISSHVCQSVSLCLFYFWNISASKFSSRKNRNISWLYGKGKFPDEKKRFLFSDEKKTFSIFYFKFFVICVLCGWEALAGSSDKVDRVFFKWQQNPSHFCSYFIYSNDKIEVRSDWWFGADPCHRSIALKFIKNHLPSQLFFVKLCGESFYECVEKTYFASLNHFCF